MSREQIEGLENREIIFSEREVVELFGAIAAKRKLRFQFREEYVTKRRDDERGLLSLEVTVPLEDRGETLVLEFIRKPLNPRPDMYDYLKVLARYPQVNMELGTDMPEQVAVLDKETGQWKFV